MLNKLKTLATILLAVITVAFILYPNISFAEENTCEGAILSNSSPLSDTIQNPQIFSQTILDNMYDMMLKIYKTFGMLFMMGHALMCYASEALFTCAGLNFGALSYCVFKIPHLSFYITGLFIYITAFFMTLSIGMYFLDVSYKLGFAVLFLPISLALWPFAPTKNKLMDNLSIIIRNGMLFAFVSVGVAYSIILIQHGVLEDAEGWTRFWIAIDASASINLGRNSTDNLLSIFSVDTWAKNFEYISKQITGEINTDEITNSIEFMTETFTLDSIKILVIIFCMVFGFKILSASINQYLNIFFSDSVFGNSSPMHHMSTQAIGTIANHTVAPVAKLAGDIAMTQTGRLIAGTGKSLKNLSSGDFKNSFTHLQKGVHAVFHPKETYNNAVKGTRKLANKSINMTGKAAEEIYDIGQLLKPGEFDNEKRQANTENFKNKISGETKPLGEKVEKPINSAAGNKTNNKSASGKTSRNNNTLTNKLRATIKEGVAAIDEYTRPTANSLTPRNILSGAKQGILHPQQSYRTLKKLAEQGIKNWQNQEGSKGKLIMKKGGQVVLRSVRGTSQEAAKGALNVAGNFLENLGKSMQNNKQEKVGKKSFTDKMRSEQIEDELKDIQQKDDEIRNQTLVD